MKNHLVLFLLFTCTGLFAQTPIVVQSKPSDVVVFLSGAVVRRVETLQLPKGRSEVQVVRIPAKAEASNIRAAATNGAAIVSLSYEQTIWTDPVVRKKIESTNDSIQALEMEIGMLADELAVYEAERKLLISNSERIGEKEGVKILELQQAADFYRKRLNEINKSAVVQFSRKTKLETSLAEMRQRHQLLTAKSAESVYTLTLQINTEQALTTDIMVEYLVSSAGWLPKYDIRTDGAGSNIKFGYRSLVFNSTGEDWKNVSITLSTADPFAANNMPALAPWRLTYYQPYYLNESMTYNKSNISQNQQAFDLKADMEMEDASNGATMSRAATESFADVEVSEMSTEFQIKERYTIPTDGRDYLVDINSYDLVASYNYVCVPKVDKDAFLVAKIPGWEQLNLVEGEASVFLRGNLIGTTTINPRFAGDSLSLSLGRDKRLVVTRVKKKDFNKNALVGSSRTESFEYEIEARNTNQVAVRVELLDQVPVSQESDIQVEILNISAAQHETSSGQLKWVFSLDPSKSQKYTIAYSVKYPKNKTVNIRQSRKVASTYNKR